MPVVFGSNERWRINRNIFVLGFAFMVHFTAFHGAANLQSSVNTDAAAGTFTLAAIYFSLILSNVFLPAIVIKWLGCKWTVALSFIAYMPFIAAQFYPHLHTLVPAGMMVGFGGGPLWCAKCTYLSVVAGPYAKLSGVPADVLVVRFFGLFFMFYQMAQIWGNLVSSAILSSSIGEAAYSSSMDVTAAALIRNFTPPELKPEPRDLTAACGVNFCSGSDAHVSTVLSSSIGEAAYSSSMDVTAAALIRNFTPPELKPEPRDLAAACGVNFCSGSDAHVSTVLSSSIGEAAYSSSMDVTAAALIRNFTPPELKPEPRDLTAACGVNFCSGSDAHDNANLEPPSAMKIQLIAGIYLACMASAVFLVAFGVDSLSRYNSGRQPIAHGKSGLRLLAVTLKQLRHKYQLLLLPVIGYIGAEQAFMAADFTQAFVGCAYGIPNIGFVMICFGVFNALAAPIAGAVVKVTGRYPVMLTALLLNLCLLSALLLWRPSVEQWFVFYLLAAIWGAADAVWLVQVNALSGILFPGDEEAAYSNFRLWEATGSVLSYASAPYLCVKTRLYILLLLLILGFSGYTTIEAMEYQAKKRHHQERNFELIAKKGEYESEK